MAGHFRRIFHQKGQNSPCPSGFVHFARYTAVSFLQRHPVCAANDTLTSGKMDKIKTIRTHVLSVNAHSSPIAFLWYNATMTKLMQKALDALNRLPEDKQDEIAEYILSISDEPVRLTEEERTAVKRGRADVKAGRFASDEEVEATFKRLRSA